jgi:hypothetical protein
MEKSSQAWNAGYLPLHLQQVVHYLCLEGGEATVQNIATVMKLI